MSYQFDTQEALKGLGVCDIPQEWINGVWDQNFCESVTLPLEMDQSVLLNDSEWCRVVQACRAWLEIAEEENSLDQRDDDTGNRSPGFWTTLLDAGVSHKLLMTLLYCLMERPKHRAVDKLCAIHGAQFYLILLRLPGSGAYKMFHPMIFQKMLDVFYLFPDRDAAQRKQSTTSIDDNPPPKSGRGRRKRLRPQDSADNEDEDFESGFQDNEDDRLGGGRGEEVKGQLKKLIKDVHCYLKAHSLSEYEASRYQLIQVMLRMARAELSSRTELEAALSSNRMEAPMCVFAWQCLDILCHKKHGPVEQIVSEVFRQLLPGMLMLGVDGGVTTSTPLPSHLPTFSQYCLTFVCHIVDRHGDCVLTPLKALIQHICTKLPDRAEYRNRLSAVVSKLLQLFPHQLYSELLDWIYKFSRNTKVGYRVFALDIVSELLGQPLRQPKEGSLSGEVECRLKHKFLLKMVLSRCSDRAPSVRGRALSALALAAGSSDVELVEAVKKSVFSFTAIDPLVATPTAEGVSRDNVIVQMVRRRTSDEKVGVRKAAIQALEGLVRLNKDHTHKEDVVILHERCLDPALSVRKQALVSLTSLLLERTHCTLLHQYWLDGVLPMVMDREDGAQEKCLQLLEDVILKNITTLKKSTSEMHHFAWHLLSRISSEDHQDLSRYLCRVLDHWAQNGKLTPALVNAVCSHTTNKDHLRAAWMLLAEISQYATSIDAKFVFDNWHQHSSNVTMETTMPLVQIIIAIGNLAQNLSKIAIRDIKVEMVQLLQGFVLNPAVIQATINTLCQICSALNKTPKDYQSAVDEWCVPLLRTCEDYLSGLMKERDSDGTDTTSTSTSSLGEKGEREAATYFFTLGEVAQLCPAHTSHHLCLMVQSILLATSDTTPITTPTTPPTSSLVSQSSHLSGLSGLSLSPSLRAHIYITLGKLCLQNEELAKRSIVHMVKELDTSKSSVERNNIIIILCDLAVRYSTKVDPYISNISSCLRDDSLLVRKQTLTLLARLLQEDYVKWRGSLFFRFVSSLVDEELRRFGEFCLVHLLLSRHPTVFYTHFVECVFHFNCYEKHKVYNRFKQADREKKLFSLKGSKHSSKRMTIYTFLLSHMADEHRFQLTAKLCQEVLGGIVDGVIPLDDDSVGVVRDTLAILKSKEIKLSSLRRNVGEELAEEGDQVGAAVATAQAKIISQIVKKNVIENIVPIVVSAKHFFEQHHSPLLKDLLLYLKELMQDYRNEVSDILTTDKQLAEEIQFDLRRLEEEQKRTAKTIQTPLTVTPHAQLISPLISSPVVLGGTGSASAATVVATPPKLKTPVAGGGASTNQTPIPALKRKTPHRIKLGMTPLVVVQKIPSPERFNRSSLSVKTPSFQTPLSSGNTADDKMEEGKKKGENVSSPLVARARASMMNTDYDVSIKTPVMLGRSVARLSLQRAVLLSTAKRAGLMKMQTPVTAEKTLGGTAAGDETLHPGRAASTPEGLAESISFNVSSLVPPSPIPPNSSLESYSSHAENKPATKQGSNRRGRRARNKTRSSQQATVHQSKVSDGRPGRKKAKTVEIDEAGSDDNKQSGADIVMLPPTVEPRRLDKWRVKLN